MHQIHLCVIDTKNDEFAVGKLAPGKTKICTKLDIILVSKITHFKDPNLRSGCPNASSQPNHTISISLRIFLEHLIFLKRMTASSRDFIYTHIFLDAVQVLLPQGHPNYFRS